MMNEAIYSITSFFQNIYHKIRKTKAPVAFAVVHQTVDGEGNYDVLRNRKKIFCSHRKVPAKPFKRCLGESEDFIWEGKGGIIFKTADEKI
jgi:hypothetical protein